MADSILEITGRVGSTVRAVSTSAGIGLRSRTHGAGVAVDLAPEAALELGEWLVAQARAQGVARPEAGSQEAAAARSAASPEGAARGPTPTGRDRRPRTGRKMPAAR
ncbi:hypothetical protein [Methylobacterium sp. PvR107]|uniref:hypothetical protein n=1 Tax=Methylobacterium sp. PvR107 TaxID=2806597 RepID=UPI001AE902EF|nr:hypothetical protein [Methylobacterium sp. PvR107]MBP1181054.1 hypothetical protein [Methylobacterium sp. PvR107]